MTDENIVALYWERNEQALDETKTKYEHYLLKIAHNVLADYEDSKESAIHVGYHSAWGVCGTGLEQTKITLGDYSAVQGTYDNKNVWDFIYFHVEDTKGYYVALNAGAEAWWDEYGTEAMEILATIKITEGVDVEYLD